MRWPALSLVLALAGCMTSSPPLWQRIPGGPSGQLSVDETICRGEMEKAAMMRREVKVYLFAENPVVTVYNGCMATRGWLRVSEH